MPRLRACLDSQQRDVEQIIDAFAWALTAASESQSFIIILDKVVGYGDELGMWLQMKPIVDPLARLIQESNSSRPGHSPRIKLFISAAVWPGGKRDQWDISAQGTVWNIRSAVYDKNIALDSFWKRNVP
ncbi:hypothetical protein ANO14919_140600 [Xylariales sp. No.14919]|nr:hypothetical protein ANO14919_140600 [Xylariales sp. No.14919]